MPSLIQAENAEGFVVYLVSAAMLVGVIWSFQSWEIRTIRKKMAKAMSADLGFAQMAGRHYAPSLYSMFLAKELEWRIARRRSEMIRYPVILAAVNFILNGFFAAFAMLVG